MTPETSDELSFLELTQQHGELLQKAGKLSIYALLTEGADRVGHAATQNLRDTHRIRVIAHAASLERHPGPLCQLGSLQLDLLGAMNALLRNELSDYADPLMLTWHSLEHRMEILKGRDVTENMDVWLRNFSQGSALIELHAMSRKTMDDAIKAIMSDIKTLYESVFASRPIAAQYVAFQKHGSEPESDSREGDTAKPTLDERAAQRRRQLAQDWWVASEVSANLGSAAGNTSQLATQRRREGQLLGVWVSNERCYRYPPWQFHPDGQPVSQMAEILRLLREPGGMASADRRTSGWQEVEWFYVPHRLLDDLPPHEVLPDDPDRVLDAATRQFAGDSMNPMSSTTPTGVDDAN